MIFHWTRVQGALLEGCGGGDDVEGRYGGILGSHPIGNDGGQILWAHAIKEAMVGGRTCRSTVFRLEKTSAGTLVRIT
jgi:hypothetical protein